VSAPIISLRCCSHCSELSLTNWRQSGLHAFSLFHCLPCCSSLANDRSGRPPSQCKGESHPDSICIPTFLLSARLRPNAVTWCISQHPAKSDFSDCSPGGSSGCQLLRLCFHCVCSIKKFTDFFKFISNVFSFLRSHVSLPMSPVQMFDYFACHPTVHPTWDIPFVRTLLKINLWYP
jgi:hypothetical protein